MRTIWVKRTTEPRASKILRRMSEEYLFVRPLLLGCWTNSQTKISDYHKKGKQLRLFVRFSSLDITALRLRDIFRIRFIIRRLVAFLSFCRLSVLRGDCFAFAWLPKQRRPGWILRIWTHIDTMVLHQYQVSNNSTLPDIWSYEKEILTYKSRVVPFFHLKASISFIKKTLRQAILKAQGHHFCCPKPFKKCKIGSL